MVALHYNFQVQGYRMFRFFSVHIALADVRFLWGKLGRLETEQQVSFVVFCFKDWGRMVKSLKK